MQQFFRYGLLGLGLLAGALAHAQPRQTTPLNCCSCLYTLTAHTDDGQGVPPDTPGATTTSTVSVRANGRVQVYTPVTVQLNSPQDVTCVWDVYASTGNGPSSYTSSPTGDAFRIIPNQPASATAPGGGANAAQYYDISCTVSSYCTGTVLYYGLYSYPVPGSGGGGGTEPDLGRPAGLGQLAAYPSPADHHLLVSVPREHPVVATVYDSQGSVRTRVVVTALTEIATQELPTGIYFLQVEEAQGQRVVKRFSVQH